MKEENYYIEIENYIKRNETNKRRRNLEDNYDTLNNYWNIGKLIVEAQGGSNRAKYGNELIKEWSLNLTRSYGKGYDYTNLTRFRQLYIAFPNLGPLAQLSWTIICKLLPIKDENKRNYYINLCIERNLSKRQLLEEIKSNSYERLVNKPKHIELVSRKKEYFTFEDIKNPIIIKVDKNKVIKSEKDLEVTILSEIEFVLMQFGKGFTFVGSQYKINNYYIDLLLFNIELNSYVVVELKVRKLKHEDKAQTEMYMDLVDNNLKKSFHNKTIGIIISKEQDEYIANFVRSNNLVPLEYIIKNN